MTPATFKSLREGLGLTSQDVADQAGVNLRTAQRWESTHEPPSDVQEWVINLTERFTDTREMVMDAAQEALESVGDDTPIMLTRFRTKESYLRAHPDGLPHTVHSALISSLAVEIAGEGLDVEVSYAPEEP